MPTPANSLNISQIGIQYFDGIASFAGVAGLTGQILQANTAAAPSYSTATYPSIAGTSGNVLTSNGTNWVSSAPATSGTVTSVSGTANQVAVANGTTTPVISLIGPYTPATYTAHGVLIGEGTSSIVATAAGSAGQVLQSGGASADPAYSTATYPSTAGTSGNVLTSDGTNWNSSVPTGGGLKLIQTQTVGSVSSVTFTTGISSTYSNYRLVFWNVLAGTSTPAMLLRINNGSGFQATNYQSGCLVNAWNSATITNTTQATGIFLAHDTNTSNSTSGWIDIFNATNGTTFMSCTGQTFSSANTFVQTYGCYLSSVTVTQFQILMASGNILGSFSLYAYTQ